MAVYYISTSKYVGSPNGSQSNPFYSLIDAQEATGYQGYWLSDNTFRLWADDTFDDRVNIADKPSLGSNFIIEPWTGISNMSKKPILTRAMRSFNWTYDSSNDVWVSSALAHIQYGGCILEDGAPLNWKVWTTSRAATAATMTAGMACFDNLTLQYFIKPRSGTPSSHIYAACAGASSLKLSRAGSFRISAIDFRLSSQGFMGGGGGVEALRGGWTIEDCEFSFMGASVESANATPTGNGLGILDNTGAEGTAYIKRCVYKDIFDSGLSPQQWENNATIRDIEIIENSAIRCGLTGYEVSLTSNSGTFTNLIENVNIRKSIARECGYGWSGNRYGSTANGFAYLTNDSSPNSILRNCVLDRCEAYNNIGKGFSLFHTSGNIEVFRSKAKNCGVGIMETSRVNWGLPCNHSAYSNHITNCGTGLVYGGGEGGKPGSTLAAYDNFISDCTIGINNNNQPGETSTADYNTIVNCGTAIRTVGTGTFTKSNNFLYNNTANYSGLTQGTDVLLSSAPTAKTQHYGINAPNLSGYYFSKANTALLVRNGFAWTATGGTYDVPPAGTEVGLNFNFPGSLDPRIAQTSERAFTYKKSGSFYFRNRFHVPSNYYHRETLQVNITGDISTWVKGDSILAADGTSTATVYFIEGNSVWLLFAQNNAIGSGVWTGNITNVTRTQVRASTRITRVDTGRKLQSFWCDGYQAAGQGPTIILWLKADYLGGSNLYYSFGADGQAPGVNLPNAVSAEIPFIRFSQDQNKWFDIITRVEMATSETAEDGIISVYLKRDGESVYTRILHQTNAKIGPRAASSNAKFQNGFVFGYWNGGVEATTTFRLSELELFDSRPYLFNDGIDLTLYDASAPAVHPFNSGQTVTLTTVADKYPNADEVIARTGTTTSGGKVVFTDPDWVAGQVKKCIIDVGLLSQFVAVPVTEL